MGQTCSCVQVVEVPPLSDPESGVGVVGRHGSCPDPLIYDLVRRSAPYHNNKGQHHLLYRKGKALIDFHNKDSQKEKAEAAKKEKQPFTSTRLILRRVKPEHSHLPSTTHIYAIRSPDGERPEQRPSQGDGEEGEAVETGTEQRSESPVSSEAKRKLSPAITSTSSPTAIVVAAAAATSSASEPLPRPTPLSLLSDPDLSVDPYTPGQMAPYPQTTVTDWVCVNEELDIYVCDTGLTYAECDHLVSISEQVCKGHYAAYTYAKQTLGCREFPNLAHACYETVHRVTHAIWDNVEANRKLQLDDREPHIVKYDVTKKERQKLDMHTDKSEWTFLIALSDGCGLDYEGGGTYFEALDATVHVQRGHALIFPGKLRHCGQRITKGLRFLLVGFLVDKSNPSHNSGLLSSAPTSSMATPNTTVGTASMGKDVQPLLPSDDDRDLRTATQSGSTASSNEKV